MPIPGWNGFDGLIVATGEHSCISQRAWIQCNMPHRASSDGAEQTYSRCSSSFCATCPFITGSAPYIIDSAEQTESIPHITGVNCHLPLLSASVFCPFPSTCHSLFYPVFLSLHIHYIPPHHLLTGIPLIDLGFFDSIVY